MSPPLVHIHYHRLPDREDVYVQELLLDDPEVKVTYQPSTPLAKPVEVGGTVILEPGSPAVWFTFPDTWHDIGRFHTADGSFTGIYANILIPCRLHDTGDAHPLQWHTTDLFLDLWLQPGKEPRLLDQDDLAAALDRGHVSEELAERARGEARRLLDELDREAWPPPVVREWTLERALQARSPGWTASSE